MNNDRVGAGNRLASFLSVILFALAGVSVADRKSVV